MSEYLQEILAGESLKQIHGDQKVMKDFDSELKKTMKTATALADTFTKVATNFKKKTELAEFATTFDTRQQKQTSFLSTQEGVANQLQSVTGAGQSGDTGIKKFGKQMKGIFKTMGMGLKSAIGPLFMVAMFMEPFEPLLEIFSAFAEILGTALMPLIEPLLEWLIDLIPYIMDFSDWLGDLAGKLVEGIASAGQWAVEFVPKIMGAITGFGTSILEFYRTLWGNIFKGIGELITNIGEFFTNAWNNVGEWFSGMFVSIGNFFATAWDNAGDWFSGIIDWFRNLPNLIIQSMQEGFEAIGNFGEDLVEGWTDFWS